MNRQLAPARPIAMHGGAPTVNTVAAPPIPAVTVSNGALWALPGVWLVVSPLYALLVVQSRGRRTSLEDALVMAGWLLAVTAAGVLFAMLLVFLRRNRLRRQLRAGTLRVGTVAQVEVLRYPQGVTVNKSNVKGFDALVDVYVAERGQSVRSRVSMDRTRMPIDGETVLLVTAPTAVDVVAFATLHGWVARRPYRVK